MYYEDIFQDPDLIAAFKSTDIVPLNCCQCGASYGRVKKDFFSHVLKKGVRHNFCSAKCRVASNTSRVYFECHYCGKSSSKVASQVKKTKNNFCSKVCACTYNNMHRDSEVYRNLSATLRAKPKRIREKLPRPKRIRTYKSKKEKRPPSQYDKKVWGPFSKVFVCKCHHSGRVFCSRTRRKYCKEFEALYSRDQTAAYKFTFNIYNYPDLFDVSLIATHGWYAVGGKNKSPVNKNGYSRDHRVSVNEAIKSGYDPYYIKHTINCELMLHSDNNKKKTASSISYADLVEAVDKYDGMMADAGYPAYQTPRDVPTDFQSATGTCLLQHPK